MGKLLIALLLIVGMVGPAAAAPFLACDPQAGAETYVIFQDGVEIDTGIAAEADGSLRYDLAGVTPGQYEFNAKACNVWGCSELSAAPFISPEAMSQSSGLRLEP